MKKTVEPPPFSKSPLIKNGLFAIFPIKSVRDYKAITLDFSVAPGWRRQLERDDSKPLFTDL